MSYRLSNSAFLKNENFFTLFILSFSIPDTVSFYSVKSWLKSTFFIPKSRDLDFIFTLPLGYCLSILLEQFFFLTETKSQFDICSTISFFLS